MDVLITGADSSDAGRAIARAFHSRGHRLVVAGPDAANPAALAAELRAEAVDCDYSDPASLARAQSRFPHQLDAVVVVTGPAPAGVDPRTATLADTAASWRTAFDRAVVSAVLTVQTVSEHLRAGGSIVTLLPACGTGPEAAAKAALSDWTADQADHYAIRGITINAVAAGRSAQPGYDGLSGTAPSVDEEIARLALFLITPAARHITGQTLHVGRGAAVSYG